MKTFSIFIGMVFLLMLGSFFTLSEPLGTFNLLAFILTKSAGFILLIVFYQLYKKLWKE